MSAVDDPSGSRSAPGRAARLLRRALVWVGRIVTAWLLVAFFCIAVAAGAVLHLDLPVSRRIVADLLTDSLTSFFQGSLTVGEIQHLGPRGMIVDSVVVRDPNEDVVLRVLNLRASADLVGIGRKLLFGTGKQSLVIDHVRAERVECYALPESDSSRPTIARAFTPARRDSARRQRFRRQIRVWLGNIEIGRAWGRGEFPDLAVVELDLGKVQGTVLATEKGAAVDVERFGTVVRGVGGADARGTAELHVRAPGAVWCNFDGFVGDVGVAAFAHFKRSQVQLRLDLPRATPTAARSVWKDWPLHDDVKLHAEATGELPLLDVKATFEVGPATVKTEAKVRLAGDVGVRADIDAQHVDLRSIVPSAPPTDISGKTRIVLFRGPKQLVVKVNGFSQPATVADIAVPATDVTGDFEQGEFVGTATLHEKGIPLKVTLNVLPNGAVDLDVDVRTFRMQRAPRLAGVTRADGMAEARIKAAIKGRQLEADVDAAVDGFVLEPVRSQHLRVVGKVRGKIDDPNHLRVDGRLTAVGVDLGAFSFQRVDLQARGPVLEPQVVARLEDDEGPSFDVSGTIAHQQRRARNLVLAVSRGGSRIEGRVADLDLGGGKVRVNRLEMSGVGGKLDGSVTVRPGLLEADVAGESIDLEAAGRLLGLEKGVLAGRVGFEAQISAGGDIQRGRIAFRLDQGALLSFHDVNVDLTSELDGAHLTGNGDFSIATMAKLDADWDTHLAGHPLDPLAWRDLVGRLSVRFTEVDLAECAWLVPPRWNIEKLGGKARATVELNRRFAAALPSINVTAFAQGIELTRTNTPRKSGAPITRTTFNDLDLQAGVSFNGESGFTLINGSVYHRLDPLLVSQARFNLDLLRIVEHPDQFAGTLRESPTAIDVELRSRKIRDWPEWMRPGGVEGAAGGELHLIGTLDDPMVNLQAKGRGLRLTSSDYGRPVDVQAALNYRVVEGAFRGNADIRSNGSRIAHVELEGQSPRAAVLADQDDDRPRWRGGAQVRFYDMPLDVVPQLHEAQVGGVLEGALSLERQSRHPTVQASLEVKNARIDRTEIGSGEVRLATTQDSVGARASLHHAGGWIRVQADAGLSWDRGWPILDDSRPITSQVDAQRFEGAVLEPFARDLLNELTGQIDADLQAEFWAQASPVAEDEDAGTRVVWLPRVSGTASMRDGVVQLAGLGMDLRGVGFDVAVSDVGQETKLEVTNLAARGRASDASLQGRADLYLHGAKLQRGVATLAATNLDIPVGGITLARATTARDEWDQRRQTHEPITVRIERQPEKMVAEVVIPTLMARLPPSVTRTVIDTSDNPDIRVRQPLRRPEAPRPHDVFPWQIVFDVGPRASVFYEDFELRVSGRPQILLGRKTTVDGYIDLERGGRLPVLGKEFQIESGRIWLDPEQPSNPLLDITASWESPYATVYLRVQGRWYDPDLELESDGAHSPDQIWIILAGGSPDDPTGSQSGGGVQAAYQAARTLGVTRLFESDRLGFTPDTNEGKTTARVSYRVSDRVRVEAIGGSETDAANASVEDSAGDPTDQQRRFVGAGAIEYRIDKNWSVRTEAGNASAEVDLLWQYRY